jgi:dipeptidyl aminopeptidase/acylaminoacyl peptidase
MAAMTSSYGSWKSPLTSDLIVSGSVGLSQPVFDGADIYWVEMRPAEGGRNVVVKRDEKGQVCDVIPAGFNSRTRVHEYGGGDFVVNKGAVYFSNFSDQRLYVSRFSDGQPQAITPPGEMRYADSIIDAGRGRLICIREDHTKNGEPRNTIVSLSLDQNEDFGVVLIEGNDFYASPRLSPDGKHLAWQSWNHPNLPWDETELWLADFGPDDSLENIRLVASGPNESILQPEWSPDGSLYFVSDRNGWWNLYRHEDGTTINLCEMKAEFALPQWLFGMSSYAFDSSNQIVCSYVQNGLSALATLEADSGRLRELRTNHTDISYVRAANGRALLRAGSPTKVTAIVLIDLKSGEQEILRRANGVELDDGYLSNPEALEFPTERELSAHGFFYRPRNRDYVAPENELPPLIVKSHGGPTAAASSALSLSTQYWTSRGFAVLDVNYGGSTGYGRSYRERLDGNWGIVDVDDCVNGAKFLVDQGLVDPKRLIITGGSAGGYTTLCALTFRRLFTAGASHYGVSDAEALARETHKFESRYLDRLFGPYPEQRQIYVARSPINFADQLSCPVIFFQGLEDKMVPPNQAEMMVEALKRKGIPVAYVAFPGEQHGFRQAKNIKRSLDGELYFYSWVFGFELADEVEPVEIVMSAE